MSLFYYVEKLGTYSHGVFGIFADLDDAIKRANDAQSKDSDDYHIWAVKLYDPEKVYDYKDYYGDNDKVLYSTPRDLTNG